MDYLEFFIFGFAEEPRNTQKSRNLTEKCDATKRFSSSLRPSRQPSRVVLSQDEIIQIITLVVDWHFPVIQVPQRIISPRERVYHLVQTYRKTGLYPALKRLCRPPNVPSPAMRNLILSEKKRLGIGSRALHKYFLFNLGITIEERMIHRVLLEENMTEPELKKDSVALHGFVTNARRVYPQYTWTGTKVSTTASRYVLFWMMQAG